MEGRAGLGDPEKAALRRGRLSLDLNGKKKGPKQELGEEPSEQRDRRCRGLEEESSLFPGETVGRPCGCSRLSRREGGRRGQIIQGPLSHGKEVGFYLEE